MKTVYFCLKLAQNIELQIERLDHILDRHPELCSLLTELSLTIQNPELVLLKETGELLFIRWFKDVLNGKFMTVVVIKSDTINRWWVVTAFVTRKLPHGELYE